MRHFIMSLLISGALCAQACAMMNAGGSSRAIASAAPMM